MWPGPYGQGGGSRKYVLASLDQSLSRLGLDYVDIFYSHRFDPTRRWRRRRRAGHRRAARGRRCTSASPPTRAERRAQHGASCARAGHAAADPPALLLDAQPLDRDRRPARRRGRRRARASSASPPLAQGLLTGQVPRRRPGGLAGRPGQVVRNRLADRRHARPAAQAQRDRAAAWSVPRAAGAGVGAARRAGDLAGHRGVVGGAAGAERRRAGQRRLSADELPRSTSWSTPRSPSTCGATHAWAHSRVG